MLKLTDQKPVTVKIEGWSGCYRAEANKMSGKAKSTITVIKFQETHADERATQMKLRLWSSLSDDSGLRDQTVGQRKFI